MPSNDEAHPAAPALIEPTLIERLEARTRQVYDGVAREWDDVEDELATEAAAALSQMQRRVEKAERERDALREEALDLLAEKNAAEQRVAELTRENEDNRKGFEFHAGRAERERDRAAAAEQRVAELTAAASERKECGLSKVAHDKKSESKNLRVPKHKSVHETQKDENHGQK